MDPDDEQELGFLSAIPLPDLVGSRDPSGGAYRAHDQNVVQ